MKGEVTVVKVVEVPEQAAFTVSAAAKYIGRSPNMLRQLANEGFIPCKRDHSNHRIFLKRDLDTYLESLPYDNVTGYARSNRSVETGLDEKGGHT